MSEPTPRVDVAQVDSNAPLVVDAADNTGDYDDDSALGDSVAGSLLSASLAPSVLDYKYENGRRYHAYHEGKYVLPNDEQEQDRLDMLHHIFRLILDGGLYKAPLADLKPQRILDMGTGTGIWPIDLSQDFPEASILGNDLSAIQPNWVPPNVRFYVDDLESAWAYPEAEHFDYIHGRALIGSITHWKQLFSEAFNNLKPGGILEVQEYPCTVNSDDDTTKLVPDMMKWVEKLNEGCEIIKKPANNAHLLKGYMEEVGFVDVQQMIYKVPIGKWAKGRKNKELGLFYHAQAVDSIEALTLALYTRVLGFSTEETQVTIAQVKKDLRNPKAHLYVPFYFIWGKKP